MFVNVPIGESGHKDQFCEVPPTAVAHYLNRFEAQIVIGIPAVYIAADPPRLKHRMAATLERLECKGLEVTHHDINRCHLLPGIRIRNCPFMKLNQVQHDEFVAVITF